MEHAIGCDWNGNDTPTLYPGDDSCQRITPRMYLVSLEEYHSTIVCDAHFTLFIHWMFQNEKPGSALTVRKLEVPMDLVTTTVSATPFTDILH